MAHNNKDSSTTGLDELEAVLTEFRDLRTSLRNTQRFLDQRDKCAVSCFRNEKDSKNIQFYLAQMEDIHSLEQQGAGKLRTFISDIHDIIRRNPAIVKNQPIEVEEQDLDEDLYARSPPRSPSTDDSSNTEPKVIPVEMVSSVTDNGYQMCFSGSQQPQLPTVIFGMDVDMRIMNNLFVESWLESTERKSARLQTIQRDPHLLINSQHGSCNSGGSGSNMGVAVPENMSTRERFIGNSFIQCFPTNQPPRHVSPVWYPSTSTLNSNVSSSRVNCNFLSGTPLSELETSQIAKIVHRQKQVQSSKFGHRSQQSSQVITSENSSSPSGTIINRDSTLLASNQILATPRATNIKTAKNKALVDADTKSYKKEHKGNIGKRKRVTKAQTTSKRRLSCNIPTSEASISNSHVLESKEAAERERPSKSNIEGNVWDCSDGETTGTSVLLPEIKNAEKSATVSNTTDSTTAVNRTGDAMSAGHAIDVDSCLSHPSKSSFNSHDHGIKIKSDQLPWCQECDIVCNDIIEHYVNCHRNISTIPSVCLPPHKYTDLLEHYYHTPQLVDVRSDNSLWECIYCCEKMEDSRRYFEHLSAHTGEFLYQCNECDFRFPTEKSLHIHLSSVHFNSSNFLRSKTIFQPQIFDDDSNRSKFDSFMCKECLYFQLRIENLCLHLLENKHDCPQSVVCVTFSGPTNALTLESPGPERSKTPPQVAIESVLLESDSAALNELLEKADSLQLGSDIPVNVYRCDSDLYSRVLKRNTQNEEAKARQSQSNDVYADCSSLLRNLVDHVDSCFDNNVGFGDEPDFPNIISVLSTEASSSVDVENGFEDDRDDWSYEDDMSDIEGEVDVVTFSVVKEMLDDTDKEMYEEYKYIPIQKSAFEGMRGVEHGFLLNNSHLITSVDDSAVRKIYNKNLVRVLRAGDYYDRKCLVQRGPNDAKEADVMELMYGKICDPASGCRRVAFKQKNVYEAMLSPDCIKHFYKCLGTHCSFTTDDISNFKRHLSTHVYEISSTRCMPYDFVMNKNYLSCAYCNLEFSTVENLCDHLLRQHGMSRYQCSYCFYRCVSKRSVKLHMNTAHYSKVVNYFEVDSQSVDWYFCDSSFLEVKMFECCEGDCGMRFMHRDKFRTHMMTAHDKSEYICSYCSAHEAVPMSPDPLITHCIMHHIFKYQCLYCPFGTEIHEDIQHHLSSLHPGLEHRLFNRMSASSNSSDGNIYDPGSVDNQVSISTPAPRSTADDSECNSKLYDLFYRCGNSACNFSTLCLQTFKEHISACRTSAIVGFICFHCAKRTKTMPSFLEHIKVHKKKNLRKLCSLCSFSTWMNSDMLKHFKTEHHVTNYKLIHAFGGDDGDLVAYPKEVAQRRISPEDLEKDRLFYESKMQYFPGDEEKVPTKAVFMSLLRCGLCSFSSKIRSNFVRHLNLHRLVGEGIVTHSVPHVSPVNVVASAAGKSAGQNSVDDAQKDEGDKWRCAICMVKLNGWDEASNHCRTVHGVSYQFSCTICWFGSNSVPEISSHVQKQQCDKADMLSEKNANVKCDLQIYFFRENALNASEPLNEERSNIRIRKQNRIKHIRGMILEESPKPKGSCSTAQPPKNVVNSEREYEDMPVLTPAVTPPKGPSPPKISKQDDVAIVTPSSEILMYCPKCTLYKTRKCDELITHIYNELKYTRYECVKCPRKYVTEVSIRAHVVYDHKEDYDENKRILSPVNKEFEQYTLDAVNRQLVTLKVSNDGTPYEGHLICRHCYAKFSKYHNFRNHLLAKHLASDRFKCDYCSATFWTERLTKLHHVKSNHAHLPLKITEDTSLKNKFTEEFWGSQYGLPKSTKKPVVEKSIVSSRPRAAKSQPVKRRKNILMCDVDQREDTHEDHSKSCPKQEEDPPVGDVSSSPTSYNRDTTLSRSPVKPADTPESRALVYKCYYCGEQLFTLRGVRQHWIRSHADTQEDCRYFEYQSCADDPFASEIKATFVQDLPSYKCGLCKEENKSKVVANEHAKQIHPGSKPIVRFARTVLADNVRLDLTSPTCYTEWKCI